MSTALRRSSFVQVNDRRTRARTAPSFPSRKGCKLIDGLSKAELVKKYEPSVRMIAQKMKNRFAPNFELDDLISVGFIGLMDAADKFNDRKGSRFLTYAEIRIRGAILDEIRRLDFIPKSARKKSKDLDSAALQIERETGTKASAQQLGEHFGLSRERITQMQTDYGNLTLIHYGEGGIQEEPADLSSANPFEEASRKDTRKWFENLFEVLPAESRQVLACYYFRGLGIKEIAAILDVCESRISQIHTKAILTLQKVLRERNQDMQSLLTLLLEA